MFTNKTLRKIGTVVLGSGLAALTMPGCSHMLRDGAGLFYDSASVWRDGREAEHILKNVKNTSGPRRLDQIGYGLDRLASASQTVEYYAPPVVNAVTGHKGGGSGYYGPSVMLKYRIQINGQYIDVSFPGHRGYSKDDPGICTRQEVMCSLSREQ